MNRRAEIKNFLVTRRARLTPAAAGLDVAGGNRRVPGLRREEVAALAGVSVDYYTRLERGDAAGVSEPVIAGLARALRLDEAEQSHLVGLLRPRRPAGSSRHEPATVVPTSVQRMLNSLVDAPAFVSNSRLDLLGVNALCAGLYADLAEYDGAPVNLARYTFLDPRAARFYPDWSAIADMTVALLRASIGVDPLDAELTALVADLSSGSADFRRRWAAHDVQRHTSGVKRFRHRRVGEMELSFDSLALAADPTLTITVYTAVPGSPSQQALRRLGAWQQSSGVGDIASAG